MELPKPIIELYPPLFENHPIDTVLNDFQRRVPNPEILNHVAEAVCQIKVARNQLLTSGIWLYAGDINAAHNLVQDMTSDSANWWHAILHRLEGDFTNASYWYRQSESHPLRQELSNINHLVEWANAKDQRCINAQKEEWVKLMSWIIHN